MRVSVCSIFRSFFIIMFSVKVSASDLVDYDSDDEEDLARHQTVPVSSQANSDIRPLLCCHGWLYKQGGKRKNWKRRWFTLENLYLTYRDKPEVSFLGCVYV